MRASRLTTRIGLVGGLLALAVPPSRAEFAATLDGTTLILEQKSDDGAVVIDNPGPGGSFRVTDLGGTKAYVPAYSLIVRFLDEWESSAVFDLDTVVVRDVTVELGGGVSLDFAGSENLIRGNLTIETGNGDQVIQLASNQRLFVGGKLTVDAGRGNDTVANAENVTVCGPVTFRGVNLFDNARTVIIIGDFSIRTDKEHVSTVIDNDGTLTVYGDLTYVGNDASDRLSINADSFIGGDMNADLGSNTASASPQFVNLVGGGRIGGDLTVKAEGDVFGAAIEMDATTKIGGKIKVDFKGNVSNTFFMYGLCGGKSIRITGGKGNDTVVFGLVARGANTEFDLGKGSDSFYLGAGTSLRRLTVDFGPGVDDFDDMLGPAYPFKVKVIDLP